MQPEQARLQPSSNGEDVRVEWVRPSRAVLVALLVIVVCGGALRYSASHNTGHHLSPDERSYGALAIGIAEHGHYGDPAMQSPTRWAPGAPVLFGLTARVFGAGRAHQAYELPAARRVQVVLGTLTIVAAFAVALLLSGPAAGLLAAAALAFYPPLITISHYQLTEPLAALLVLLAVLAVVAGKSTRWAVAAGVLLGLAVLTRADLLLAPLAAALALLWAERNRRRAAALLVAGVVVVLPWTVFVSINHGQVVPVSEGGPSNLFIGTYLPGHGTIYGFKRSLAPEARRRYPYLHNVPAWKIPAGVVLRAVAARRPHMAPDKALIAESKANLRRYALGDPLGFARMTGGKVVRMWQQAFHSPQPAIVAAHLALLAVALAGLLLGLRARAPAAAVIAAIVVWSTIDNAILVAEPRHNMPLMPALAAVGIAAVLTRLRVTGLARRPRRLLALGRRRPDPTDA
jgi:4-amino-4-deoxy-L-arabinose transferase-like glycosyltransferase